MAAFKKTSAIYAVLTFENQKIRLSEIESQEF